MKKIAFTTRLYFIILALICATAIASAQVTKKYRFVNGRWVEVTELDNADAKAGPAAAAAPVDTVEFIEGFDADGNFHMLQPDTTLDVTDRMFPSTAYLPAVFDSYDMSLPADSVKRSPAAGLIKGLSETSAWVNDAVDTNTRLRRFKQDYMIAYPQLVRYNINTLPEAPKQYRAFVDPSTAHITVEEIVVDQQRVKDNVGPIEVKKKHWLQQFDGLIQFSQAYNSPNWYQGGNNNLNTIIQGIYNLRLNQAFHPNLLFENTLQYKLGLNSAPDDSLRSYSISEDLLQLNTKFGVKAAKRWYYSTTLQFKTQLLNNYRKNTNDLQASFLSPGELNLGLGMTYEYATPSGNFKTNASIAPLSYNLKICTNSKINETQFGIKEGHTTVSQYGSNIDCNLEWKIAYNINFRSKLTAFTNYSYVQGDWENTLSFNINRFLSTQIYVHLRYDSTTRHVEDSKWHKWQLREVLSFGFAYKIGRL